MDTHHNILLVEDEPRLAASIAEYLGNHPFAVTVEQVIGLEIGADDYVVRIC